MNAAIWALIGFVAGWSLSQVQHYFYRRHMIAMGKMALEARPELSSIATTAGNLARQSDETRDEHLQRLARHPSGGAALVDEVLGTSSPGPEAGDSTEGR